jgi:DNA invertase Pin-like site-specific DNA recombinase
VFAQLERGMITARLRAGRKLKREQGGYADGAPPFGARREEVRQGDRTVSALVPHPLEAATIARILERRGQGASLRAIVETLEAEGYRTKRGKAWHPQTVARILARAEAI